MKLNLLGKNIAELKQVFLPYSAIKDYTHKQICLEIYRRGTTEFNKMTSLSILQREMLGNAFEIKYPQCSLAEKSVDGTRKWLLDLDDDLSIETVFIPDELTQSNNSTGTLCVSSQVGCSLKCSFCHTGTQKFKKNLDSSEIVGQVMFALHELNDFPLKLTTKKRIDNIVFMGQGEPLYNFKNLSKSLDVLINQLNFAAHRITVSTSGLVPLIPKLAEFKCGLAISLHAPNDQLRNELVPLNKMYPIKDLLKACRQFLEASNQKQRITFEYVLLKGVNDSILHADQLARILSGIPSLVNIIPWNPWPGAQYTTSTQIQEFSEHIKSKHIQCTVRKARGSDIMAACGQLKSSQESKGLPIN